MRRAGDGPGRRPPEERGGAAPTEAGQCGGEVGLPHAEVGGRRRAVGVEKGGAQARVGAQQVEAALDLATQVRCLGEREAVGREPHRRLEHTRERQSAEAPVEHREPRRFAGNGDGETSGTCPRLDRLAALEVAIGGRRGGRAFSVVEGDVPSVREMDEGEPAAAETARRGMDDADRRGRGDGRVDDRTARAQDLRAGGRREGMLRGDRAAARAGAGGGGERHGEDEDGERTRHEPPLSALPRVRATGGAPCRGGGVW